MPEQKAEIHKPIEEIDQGKPLETLHFRKMAFY